jgi:hypothetical protein
MNVQMFSIYDVLIVVSFFPGRKLEFDTPINLLEDKSSAFLKLVSEYLSRSTSNISDF